MRATLLILAMVTSMTDHAQTANRVAPPPPAPPRPYEFPRAASRTLANGLRVFVIEDRRLPLVAASMQLLAGHAYAPPEKAGLAMMTAALLREGTKTRSSQQIARAVDGAGGRLEANAGNDVATISMTFLKSHAETGFELMADIVENPVFAPRRAGAAAAAGAFRSPSSVRQRPVPCFRHGSAQYPRNASLRVAGRRHAGHGGRSSAGGCGRLL